MFAPVIVVSSLEKALVSRVFGRFCRVLSGFHLHCAT